MSGYQGNIIIKNPATPAGPAENGAAPGVWTLSEALAFKRQGIWPTQGVIPADPYFSYTTLLLSTTSLGNANNNLFVDSSGAFNPISRNGNTTQGSATPYGANWSNYFDGDADNLTLPSSASYAIASSTTPFTVEAWIYPTAGGGCVFSEAFTGSGTIPIVISMSTGTSVDGLGGLYIGFGWFTGSAWVTAAIASSAVTANTWTHVACVFTGSTTKIYYNGVDVTKPSSPTPATAWGVTGVAGDSWYIGRRWDGAGSNWFSGYISNLRFVNGTAVYTSAFTPPTTPLTAIANTVLLTCQSNRFRDTSTGNATITVVGNTRVTDFSPFSPGSPGISYNQSDITNWSGYFDGSGDYLDIAANTALNLGNGDFTFETWFNQTSSATTTLYCQISGGFALDITPSNGTIDVSSAGVAYIVRASQTVAFGTWNHVAVTRSGNVFRVYYNGVQIGTATDTTTFTSNTTNRIGAANTGAQPFIGYLSNTRLVKGSVVYTGNFTPPTSPLTAISGTSLLTLQNAAFTDNSTNNFVITPFGNTTVTGNSPFNAVGYWSNYFDGSGDYLSVPNNAAFSYGTGDFTMEAWVYKTASGDMAVVDSFTSGGGTFGFLVNDTQVVGYQTNVVAYTFTYTVPRNTWTHIAFVRTGGNLICYVNGTSIGSQANSANFTSSNSIAIGRNPGSGGSQWQGYISNLRIVKGTAVYTSNFTPPTTPLTAITNTSLLTCQNGRFIDNSTNAFTITVNGNTAAQSFDPFYTSTIASNGGSMYFDGTGDYLALQNNPSYALGSGDFIVETWVYPTVQGGHGSSNNDCILDFRPGSATGGYGCLYSNNNGANICWFIQPSNVITGSAIPNGAWSHLVVSRVSGSTRLFINGVQSGSTYTDSTNYLQTNPRIGQFNDGAGSGFFQGYMSGTRIVKGSGVSSTFTPPTAPVTPSANTTLLVNGMNAGIYDATAINDMETVGNAQVSTAVSKFGGSSVYFDGSSRLTMPSTADMDLSTGDFTVEAWVYSNTLSGTGSAATRAAAGNVTSQTELQWGIYRSGSSMIVRVYQSTSDFTINVGTIAANTWYHVALTRSGNTVRGFLNGVLSGTTHTVSGALNNNAAWFGAIIGGITVSGGSEYWNGYIDDLRVTKGYARYTSNFTPPTQPFVTY